MRKENLAIVQKVVSIFPDQVLKKPVSNADILEGCLGCFLNYELRLRVLLFPSHVKKQIFNFDSELHNNNNNNNNNFINFYRAISIGNRLQFVINRYE